MSFSNSILHINTKTYDKDCHGLYNYEAPEYECQSFELHHSSALIKDGKKLGAVRASGNSQYRELLAAKGGMVALISGSQDGIKVSPTNTNNENQFWFSVDEKIEKDRKGYPLKENDVVKMGRVTVVVRQVKSREDKDVASIYRSPILHAIKKEYSVGSVSSLQGSSSTEAGSPRNEFTCRICLTDSKVEGDPLVCPCNCSDTRKYVHYKCMQQSMRKRSSVLTNEKIIDLNWKKLNCEQCNSVLPLTMMHEGKELMMVPLSDQLSRSYAVLEFFSRDNSSTGVFLVGLTMSGTFKIGRGEECDIQVDDNSVSRVHAELTVSNGRMFIKDNVSRFGTLVAVKEPFVLNNIVKNYWIQCGNTLIEFSLRKPWISYLPCFDSLCNNHHVKNVKTERSKALKEEPRIEAKLVSEESECKKSPLTLL